MDSCFASFLDTIRRERCWNVKVYLRTNLLVKNRFMLYVMQSSTLHNIKYNVKEAINSHNLDNFYGLFCSTSSLDLQRTDSTSTERLIFYSFFYMNVSQNTGTYFCTVLMLRNCLRSRIILFHSTKVICRRAKKNC